MGSKRRRVAAATFAALWCTVGGGSGLSQTAPRCPTGTPLPLSDTFLAYVGQPRITSKVVVGPFRALAVLRESELSSTNGSFIHDGMKFWRMLAPESAPIELTKASSFMERVGPNHCVFHSKLRGGAPQEWTLLSSKPLLGVLRKPTAADTAEFAKLNTLCVVQGDPSFEVQPPCTPSKLLAVSDLDANDRAEYWATHPYKWDTGITVWELTEEAGLVVLLSVCSGCSD